LQAWQVDSHSQKIIGENPKPWKIIQMDGDKEW